MSSKIFEKSSFRKPKYSGFDLSHDKKLSGMLGKLYPTLCMEVLPGDSFKVRTELMVRMSPLVAPVMHRLDATIHFFFVPNRLLWTSWEDFITGGKDGTSTPTMPTIQTNTTKCAKGNLPDYLGFPIITSGTYNPLISALPFRAYQLIWNEYYRDPNVVNEIDIHTMNDLEHVELRRRCWEKDYFTSALPFTQRGTAVGLDPEYKDPATLSGFTTSTGGDVLYNAQREVYVNESGSPTAKIENIDGSLFDINELRTSHRIQRWLETQAKTGYRYIETLLGQFGVNVPDHRLQRPEFLGGTKRPIVISEIPQTSQTATTPQGTLAGHGIGVGETGMVNKKFVEHGFLMGIMSILPKTAYQQGMSRMWSRDDKFDYFWPELAHLGEQSVKRKELYLDDTSNAADNDQDFGYQQRYAEYKYEPCTVHGDFRDDLEHWTFSRQFGFAPSLNQTFLECTPREDAFAVTDPNEDKFYCQVYNDVKARRPMPYFADPRL